jgi:hypothetical protein
MARRPAPVAACKKKELLHSRHRVEAKSVMKRTLINRTVWDHGRRIFVGMTK